MAVLHVFPHKICTFLRTIKAIAVERRDARLIAKLMAFPPAGTDVTVRRRRLS
jgi:hypothetical protein